MNGIDLNSNANIIPDDLDDNSTNTVGPEEFSTGTASFDLKKYKNWIILLIVTILVFIGVIALINHNNQQIEDKLQTSDNEVVATNPDQIPAFFTANLLGLENEAPTNVENTTPTSTTTAQNTTTEPVVDDSFVFPEDFSFDDLNAATDNFPIVNTESQDSGDSIADLLAASDFNQNGEQVDNSVPTDNIGLNTNTMPEALMSAEMQGDTGPALWFALIPSLAYGLLTKRKS